MKHQTIVLANAAGATAAIIFIACRLLVGIVPDFMFSIAQSWFHKVQLTKFGSTDLTTGNFILGLVSSTITAWLIAYIFSTLYRRLMKS